ncbi:hypothetical protein CDD80_1854 [Ophiocordyceps camponoti-rufipedis]|uniref:Uncharacterized protein n=1 Tax=Ophiocordyceps camponoti-rufipedis TaxID=2004952 RepID=A0A2C5XW51_9HYPO|nr:hypothetical protein CDD80_1854 [Ophiocordyceps camponoti-rufipedis]
MKLLHAGITALAALAAAKDLTLRAAEIPVGCATICGPAVELVSRCNAGRPNARVKRQAQEPGPETKMVDVWVTSNGTEVPDEVVNRALAQGQAAPVTGELPEDVGVRNENAHADDFVGLAVYSGSDGDEGDQDYRDGYQDYHGDGEGF